MYRLNDQIVARIGQPGSEASAEREVCVSRWLTQQQYPVTQLASGLLQPTVITDRAVTWWRLISEHRPATPAELGEMLRMLHKLPVPGDLRPPFLDPFCEIAERIDNAPGISEMEHNWLAERYCELVRQYRETQFDDRIQVIHGDAWQGNVVVPEEVHQYYSISKTYREVTRSGI